MLKRSAAVYVESCFDNRTHWAGPREPQIPKGAGRPLEVQTYWERRMTNKHRGKTLHLRLM